VCRDSSAADETLSGPIRKPDQFQHGTRQRVREPRAAEISEDADRRRGASGGVRLAGAGIREAVRPENVVDSLLQFAQNGV
jgi:hypothetical protein